MGGAAGAAASPVSVDAGANCLVLTAAIVESQPLRYTPAGLPAIDAKLEHLSTQSGLGQPRQVRLVLRAQAFGTVAERMARLPLGSQWRFTGFLVTPRNAKHAQLQIQEFQAEPGSVLTTELVPNP